MANYGEVLDSGLDDEHMYKSFVDYFSNPLMTKIKNVDSFTMYMAKTHCLLSRECRYIVAFITIDAKELGSTEFLSNLQWKSIQTRTMSDYHNLPSHPYTATNKGPLKAVITRVEKNAEQSTYVCESLPLKVTILHTKKKGMHDLQDKGTIIAALETWQTVVTLK